MGEQETKIEPFCISKLTDVIDHHVLELIQIGFSESLQAPMTIVMKEGDQYVRIPAYEYKKSWTEFCKYLRSFEKGNELCVECSKEHIREIIENNLQEVEKPWYICHAGLIDLIIPITVGGKVVAGFVGGQKRLKGSKYFDENPNKSIQKLATEIDGLDTNRLLQLKQQVPEMTEEEIKAYVKGHSEVVKCISELATIRFETSRDLQKHLLFEEVISSFRDHRGEPHFSKEILLKVIEMIAKFSLMEWGMFLSDTHRELDVMYPMAEALSLDGLFDKTEYMLQGVRRKAYRRQEMLSFWNRDRERKLVLEQLERIVGISPISVAYIKPILFRDRSRALFLCMSSSLAQCDIFDEEGLRHKGDFLKNLLEGMKDQIDIYQAERIQENFMADVTHKLKAPMQWLNSEAGTLIEYCKKSYEEDSRITEQCKAMEDAVDLLDSQTKSFSFLTVMDKEDIRYNLKVAHPIGVLLQTCINRFKNMETDRGIEIVSSFYDSVWKRTYFDWNWMEVVFNNLLDNAIKYSHRNKEIRVNAKGFHENFYYISFSNFGLGISEREYEDIFKRYYRGKEMQDPRRFIPGTGIGLTVARKIVRDHRGDITVTSRKGLGQDPAKEEGYNTTFTVTLPIRKEIPK